MSRYIHRKKIYNCDRADTLNMTSGRCFMAYTKREGVNSRIKVSAEGTNSGEVTEDDFFEYIENDISNGGHNVEIMEGLSAIEISDGNYNCEQLIGDETKDIIDMIFLIIRIATPILLIVLTMLDYSKAIASGDDELRNATTRFIKRAIATLLIFLAPTLINFLMDITGITDGTCGIDF